MTSYCRAPLTFAAHQKPTVGDSKFSAVGVDHMGWLLCDGRLLSKTSYAFLYNVIGDSFGTSGTMFRLPNPAGKVPGVVGTGTDVRTFQSTFTLGVPVGEYVHTLTIPELASHNHGTGAGVQNALNMSTSTEATGIVRVNSTMTTISDAGHAHSYTDAYTVENNGSGGTLAGASDSDNNTFYYRTVTGGSTDNPLDAPLPTSSTIANIVNPYHGHDITDPKHFHLLNPAGGDLPHNNVQPTLPMGNMFIYCGLYNAGAFPYTTGSNLW